jgi:hypothetical protein
VSARNAPDLFDLRCHVREGIVAWLQHTHPGALPRWRIERFDGPTIGSEGRNGSRIAALAGQLGR